jgi:hypothetical protein
LVWQQDETSNNEQKEVSQAAWQTAGGNNKRQKAVSKVAKKTCKCGSTTDQRTLSFKTAHCM